jgi:hypothetical protein
MKISKAKQNQIKKAINNMLKKGANYSDIMSYQGYCVVSSSINFDLSLDDFKSMALDTL